MKSSTDRVKIVLNGKRNYPSKKTVIIFFLLLATTLIFNIHPDLCERYCYGILTLTFCINIYIILNFLDKINFGYIVIERKNDQVTIQWNIGSIKIYKLEIESVDKFEVGYWTSIYYITIHKPLVKLFFSYRTQDGLSIKRRRVYYPRVEESIAKNIIEECKKAFPDLYGKVE